ncbi:MAG: spore coat associated protein CotJA [Wujia sp.]
MEPYRGYGRGMYGRGMNQCDTTRRNQTNCSNTNTPKPMPADCGCKDDNRNSRTNFPNDCSSKTMHTDCGCKDDNKHMRNMPLAMGFVQMQEWERLYNPEEALKNGTAFPCLNLIFCGARGKM